MTRANEITNDCLVILQSHGFMAWRQNNTPAFDQGKQQFRKHKSKKKGVPDIIAIEQPSGRFWGVEVKAGGDKMSVDQKAFRAECQATGGRYLVVRSAWDLMEAIQENMR